MLGLKLNHVSKNGPSRYFIIFVKAMLVYEGNTSEKVTFTFYIIRANITVQLYTLISMDTTIATPYQAGSSRAIDQESTKKGYFAYKKNVICVFPVWLSPGVYIYFKSIWQIPRQPHRYELHPDKWVSSLVMAPRFLCHNYVFNFSSKCTHLSKRLNV